MKNYILYTVIKNEGGEFNWKCNVTENVHNWKCLRWKAANVIRNCKKYNGVTLFPRYSAYKIRAYLIIRILQAVK